MSFPLLRRLAAGCLVLLAALLLPAPAHAGTLRQVLCADPATGTAVTPPGALPDGFDNPSHFTRMSAEAGNARCGSTGIFLPHDATTGSAHQGAALRYDGTYHVQFVSAQLYRHWTGSTGWGLFTNRGTAWYDMWAAPYDDRCSSHAFYGCTSRGTPAGQFVAANRATIARGTETRNGFVLSVLCDPNPTCAASAAEGLRFFGGVVTLEDVTDPKVAGPLAGDLLDDAPLRGEREVSLQTSDTGAGVYRLKLLADNEVRATRLVHDNGGRCADVVPGDGDPYQFAYREPCRREAGGTFAFDTRELPEGRHNLKLQIEDASGNVAVAFSKSAEIDNIPAPSAVAAPSLAGTARRGSGLVAAPGTYDDHGADGDPVVTRAWQRCRADGSECSDIPGADGLAYQVTDADLNRRLRVVETARNGEGEVQAASPLTSRVTREDGTLPPDNDGIDNDGDGQVDEPGETGPPGATGSSAGSGGGVLLTESSHSSRTSSTVTNTTTSTTSSTVNGEGGSSDARLSVAFTRGGARGKVAYGRSLTARGTLVDGAGRPIRGAIVDVAETKALRGAKAALRTPAVTGEDGAFSVKVSSRPGSRSVAFQYRYQRQGAVVAQRTLPVTVKAGVRLSVRLRGVRAAYSGRVMAGAMPRGGKLVIVQGRVKGGVWQTFASPRTRRAGSFRGVYKLKVRRPGRRLQFRVRVLGESGWNYGATTSRPVTRTVR